MISAANALRPGKPLTDEEMKNRVCTCPENPDVDEWGRQQLVTMYVDGAR